MFQFQQKQPTCKLHGLRFFDIKYTQNKKTHYSLFDLDCGDRPGKVLYEHVFPQKPSHTQL